MINTTCMMLRHQYCHAKTSKYQKKQSSQYFCSICEAILNTSYSADIYTGRLAILMIAFPRVRCMVIYISLYMYIFTHILVSFLRVCFVYVVKEIESSRGAQSINGRCA